MIAVSVLFFFFSSRRRHTRYIGDWSSDVCSSDLVCVTRLQAPGVLPYDLVAFDESHKLAADRANMQVRRSEERRVGKECRSRRAPSHKKKKKKRKVRSITTKIA